MCMDLFNQMLSSKYILYLKERFHMERWNEGITSSMEVEEPYTGHPGHYASMVWVCLTRLTRLSATEENAAALKRIVMARYHALWLDVKKDFGGNKKAKQELFKVLIFDLKSEANLINRKWRMKRGLSNFKTKTFLQNARHIIR